MTFVHCYIPYCSEPGDDPPNPQSIWRLKRPRFCPYAVFPTRPGDLSSPRSWLTPTGIAPAPLPTDLAHVEGLRDGVFDLARTAKYDSDTLVPQSKPRLIPPSPSSPALRRGFSFRAITGVSGALPALLSIAIHGHPVAALPQSIGLPRLP